MNILSRAGCRNPETGKRGTGLAVSEPLPYGSIECSKAEGRDDCGIVCIPVIVVTFGRTSR